MEKVTKSLEEVLRAKKALDQLLTFPGISYKKVYWFGRNRDEIFKVAKVFDKERDGIFMRFATVLNKNPFIPFSKYSEFKRELLAVIGLGEEPVEHGSAPDAYGVFLKYEVFFEGKRQLGIPIEKQEDYEKEVNILVDTKFNSIDLNIWKIDLDPALEEILGQLPGEDQLSLAFLFSDMKSTLIQLN